MKMCAGDGCTAPVTVTQTLCASCLEKQRQTDVARAEYAADGLARLETYLARWAEFEELYGPNE